MTISIYSLFKKLFCLESWLFGFGFVPWSALQMYMEYVVIFKWWQVSIEGLVAFHVYFCST